MVSATLVTLALLMTGFVLAEYAYTKVYFNVPTVTTFRVRMPSNYTDGRNISITAVAEASADATGWISFNFSALPDNDVEPYVEGRSGEAQASVDNPIFMYENSGNTDINISLYWNSSLAAGYTVTANGSGVDCTVNNIQSLTSSSDPGSLIVGDLTTTGHANVTLYANASASATDSENELFHKSVAS